MALTWRNVDAPSFAGSLQGYQASSEMLNKALGTLDRSLGSIEARNAQANDATVLARLSQYTDPNQTIQALQSGQLLEGVNVNTLSPEVFQTLTSHVGTLQSQRYNSLLNDNTEYTNTRTREQDAVMDALAPFGAEISQFAAQGNQEGIIGVLNNPEFVEIFSKLSLPEQTKFRDDALDTANTVDESASRLETDLLTRNQIKAQMARSKSEFDLKLNDRKTNEQVALYDEQVAQLSDVHQVRRLLDSIEDPIVRGRVRANAATSDRFSEVLNPTFKDFVSTATQTTDFTFDPVMQEASLVIQGITRQQEQLTQGIEGMPDLLADTSTTTAQVAKQLSDMDIGVSAGKATEQVNKLVRGLKITPAAASSLIQNTLNGTLFGRVDVDEDGLADFIQTNAPNIRDRLDQVTALEQQKSQYVSRAEKYKEGVIQSNAVKLGQDKLSESKVNEILEKALKDQNQLIENLPSSNKDINAGDLIPNLNIGGAAESTPTPQQPQPQPVLEPIPLTPEEQAALDNALNIPEAIGELGQIHPEMSNWELAARGLYAYSSHNSQGMLIQSFKNGFPTVASARAIIKSDEPEEVKVKARAFLKSQGINP